jgi:hypothetical protein
MRVNYQMLWGMFAFSMIFSRRLSELSTLHTPSHSNDLKASAHFVV